MSFDVITTHSPLFYDEWGTPPTPHAPSGCDTLGDVGASARRRAAVSLAGPFTAVLLLPPPAGQWTLLADPRPEVVVGAITVLVAIAVAWLLAAWAALMCAAAVGSRLPGASGAMARRLLTAITPVMLRRVVMTAAGLSVAAGLAACGSPGAVAALQPTTSTAVVTSTPAGAFGIDLDWPVTVPIAEAPPASASEHPAAGQPTAAAPAAPNIEAPDMTPSGATPDPSVAAPAGDTIVEPTPDPTHPASPRDRDSSTAGPRVVEEPLAMGVSSGVVVRPGDSLWSIAAAQLPGDATAARIDAAWRAWYRANRDIIGPNPNLVIPGQVLYAPDGGTADATSVQETVR